MFRRKGEDSLFDNATDSDQGETVESATVVTPQSYTPPSNVTAHTPVTAVTQPSSQPVSRPVSEPRSGAVPAANSFRPAASATAPIGNDMARNRMPEAKTNVSSMAASPFDKTHKPGRRVLTVGNDILLKGEIATCDRLVIEGKVDATLNDVHTVEISENGSFKGSANIEEAEISGLFEGDLVVRNCLVIRSTGKVRGKISFGEVEIERGGELTGEIKLASAQPSSSNRPARAVTKEDNKVAA